MHQVGGGINADNAHQYLEAGASHVIVTSYVFKDGQISMPNLQKMVQAVGKHRLVLDLSCRKKNKMIMADRKDPRATEITNVAKKPRVDEDKEDDEYYVVTDRWQKYTDVAVNPENLHMLSQHCDEFLVHGVEVEGKRQGILEDLVRLLSEASPIPVTYAGGVRSMDDLERVKRIGRGKVHLTIGSALDVFGGDMPYQEVVRWQREQEEEAAKC